VILKLQQIYNSIKVLFTVVTQVSLAVDDSCTLTKSATLHTEPNQI